MQNRLIYIVLFFLSFIHVNHSQSEEEIFKSANEAYVNEQYDSAFFLYSKIESQDKYSVELFQNMGTVAYKLDDVPNAVYYFEKGLKLHPGNKDLLHNLELANKKVVDKSPKVKRNGFSAWLSNSVGHTADFWAYYAVIFCISGLLFLLIYLFIKTAVIKRLGLIMGIIFWISTFFFTVFAYVQGAQMENRENAIIFTPSVEIKNEPSAVASTAFVLHEGTKVKILDTTEEWCKIEFTDDKVGWIKMEDFKII